MTTSAQAGYASGLGAAVVRPGVQVPQREYGLADLLVFLSLAPAVQRQAWVRRRTAKVDQDLEMSPARVQPGPS